MRAPEGGRVAARTTRQFEDDLPAVFSDDGPRLQNTAGLDGAFVELSRNAAGSWATAVFEMSHETVHLLDPVVDHTTWLEEGVAVEFSLHAQRLFGLRVLQPSSGVYLEALRLVRLLPGGALAAARRARSDARALGAVTPECLGALFPTADAEVLRKLAETCYPGVDDRCSSQVPVRMSRLPQTVLATVPLLLTPAVVYGLAEGLVGFGGGERDVLLVVPWLLWSVVFAISGYVLIYRRWTIGRWVLRAALVATGLLVAVWLILLACSILGVL